MTFLTGAAEENLMAKNKDNKEFMSQNYRSDSCPLFVKLAYLF